MMSIGMTICVAPLTTTVLGAVDARHAGIASGINNVVARAASLLAVAAFGVIMLNLFGRALDQRLRALPTTPETRAELHAQRDRLADLQPPPGLNSQLQTSITRAINDSFVTGFRWVAALSAILAAASALVSWLLIGSDARTTTPLSLRPIRT
jgi:hypothetical protein